MKPVRLIVNADDYGRTAGVSAGIRQAHLYGIVTSTTAMMNMPAVEAALQQAAVECPRLGIGVHLLLTSGKPVLPAEKVPSLLSNRTGFPGRDEFIKLLPSIEIAEVQAEWRAQIERYIKISGRKPDHLDSHHHSSYFTPQLFEAMLELAHEYACPIRQPYTEGQAVLANLPNEAGRLALKRSAGLLAKYPVHYPARFIDSFYDQTATLSSLHSILRGLAQNNPREPAELMTHPGFADSDLADGSMGISPSSYNQQRAGEVAALTDHNTLALVKELGIQLISFGELS
jgi:predicted glycoside hydrolase/deacetylase ChbG (UPF0249 family)